MSTQTNSEWRDITYTQIVGPSVTTPFARANHHGNRRNLNEFLTYMLVGSVAFGASLEVVSFVFNIEELSMMGVLFTLFVNFQERPLTVVNRVMLTNWVVAMFSLLGLSCEAAATSLLKRETVLPTVHNDKAPRHSVKELFPKVGLFLSTLSALLLILLVWFPYGDEDPDGGLYSKVSRTVYIFTLATVHICLLCIATAPRRLEILFWTAVPITLLMATIISVSFFYPIFMNLEDFLERLVVVLGVCHLAIASVIFGTMQATRQAENPNSFAMEREIVATKQQLDLSSLVD